MLSTRLSLLKHVGRVRCLSAQVHTACANEPMKDYVKGTPERKGVEEALDKLWNSVEEIPCVIGGQNVESEDVRWETSPFDHGHRLSRVHHANKAMLNKAIDAALAARKEWEARPLEERVKIFNKAADLIAGKYRYELLAAGMLVQGKTVWQAEIDIVTELADFYRFHAQYALDLAAWQPLSTEVSSNKFVMRGMEGFVAAVSPFNFAAIGGNLAGTPAMMGNVVLWKPSRSCIQPSYRIFNILREAGVPDGVINFVPSTGPDFGDAITSSPHLAAVNFTGSNATFSGIWKQVAQNLDKYITYPRLVGETGGKNYHLIHKSADIDTVVNCSVRSAFEYGGQKCSACSRLYVPDSMWPTVKEKMLETTKQLKLGPTNDFTSFLSAVIDGKSFDNIKTYLDYAKSNPNVTVLAGGNCDKSKGYFVEPTIVETSDPHDKLMTEEIFGPVVAVYVYPENKYDETIQLVNGTSEYGLTGAIFARDQGVIDTTQSALRDSAGNFYINDKCTGAVVGQQPFGGARGSGTNDKAGAPSYILRWVSPQTVKETHNPITDWRYPHMS
ncbi:delta-1-pyrroline-5-carboxylate dehydrogenase, mitochondrial-like [Amphiura filiformis]|uniref:delta-1-pyrroline-5-carboxylate dehydrogenase, mitochondrial-like n=1 Tax=Amphiura filiformis TaxID=82378 RepID=UPI003B21642C